MPFDLSIVLNGSQTRLKEDALSTLVSGLDWDPTSYRPYGSSGAWVDPITNTAMLEPNCWNPNWPLSNSGIYAKYSRTDFGLTGASWQDVAYDSGGPFYQYLGSNTAGLFGTGPVQAANQGMVIEQFPFSGGNGVYPTLVGGWSNTGDGSVGVSFRQYNNGSMEIWKNAVLVGGNLSISGQNMGYFTENAQQGSPPTRLTEHYMTTAFIPCRDRELLVVSSAGGGFSYVFLDLDEAVGGQTITDNATFWFGVPAPVTPILRIAQLQFAANGTLSGMPSGWRLPPPGGDPTIKIYRDLTGNGTISCSAASAGFPNPLTIPNPVQLQFALTGGPSVSPFLYGGRAYYDAQTAETSSADQDVTDYCVEADFDFSDTAGGRHTTLTFNRPSALSTIIGQDVTEALALPIAISTPSGLFQTGVCEPPEFTDDSGVTDDDTDAVQTVTFTVRDTMKDAEEFIFSDCIPQDGLSLGDAFRAVATAYGAIATVSASADSYIIKPGGVPAGGGWNLPIDVGDRASDWYEKLHTSFCGNWALDVDASNNVTLTDPLEMSTTSAITLYRTQLDAMTIGGFSDADAYRYVYRKFKKHCLEPECNDLWIMGIDPRSGRPIILHYRDDESADPTTAPGDRGDNWIGKIKKASYGDPHLNTLGLVQRCMDLLKPRVTVKRTICEFECEFLDGIGKGQLVTLDSANVSGPVRIKTYSGSFQQVGGIWDPWRPSTYIAEAGSLVCPLGVAGTSIAHIKQNWALKGISKRDMGLDAVMAARRPLINVQES